MIKNRISFRFRLFSLLGVLLSTVAAKVLRITASWAASDITVSSAFATVCRYGSELFNLIAIAFAITVTVYAHSYFGKKNCIKTSLISLACLTFGKLVMYLYNVIFNELGTAKLISGAFSYAVEILFDALIILTAIIFSYTFAKKRARHEKENSDKVYSPQKSAFATAGFYYFLLVADLSAFNVIPFFIKYNDPTESEIATIISDYLYYIFCAVVTILLIALAFTVITKITGKLKLKIHYTKKEKSKS